MASPELDLRAFDASLTSCKFYENTSAAEVLSRSQDAEVLISNKVYIGSELMVQLPNLKLICIAATGTNNVDLEAARNRGVTVTNVAGYSTNSVVQHALTLILNLYTNIWRYINDTQAGSWQRSSLFCGTEYPVYELAGKKLAIVGYGAIGQGLAKVASALGMEILVADLSQPDNPRPGRLSLKDLLPQADILSLHCPYNPSTHHLINSETLALLPEHAILINTARGPLIDEAALAQALVAGSIAGAGLDVLSSEPPESDNPLLTIQLPNLIITPHTAWMSVTAKQKLIDEIAANIVAFEQGRSRNVVS